MTYRVQFSPHAIREYRALDPSIKPRIAAGIEALQQHPLSGSKIKRLAGRLKGYARYRTGEYRIVYVVDTQARAVRVDYIQHRKDVYR